MVQTVEESALGNGTRHMLAEFAGPGSAEAKAPGSVSMLPDLQHFRTKKETYSEITDMLPSFTTPFIRAATCTFIVQISHISDLSCRT